MNLDELKSVARRPRHEELTLAKAIYRHPSIHVTRALLPTRVTPNQVTAVGLIVCAAGAALIGAGEPALALGGVLTLHASLVLAAVDGELARARSLCSWRGVYFDYIGTRWVKPLLILLGLTANVLLTHGPSRWLTAAALLAVGALPALDHAARHWLWIQRMKATDEIREALGRGEAAGLPQPETSGLLGVVVAVADGHPYALTHLLTVALVVDLFNPLPLRALDVLFGFFVFIGPLAKAWNILRPAGEASLEADYQRALVEIADPRFLNFQRVEAPAAVRERGDQSSSEAASESPAAAAPPNE